MDCLTELAKEVVTKLGDLVVDSTVKHFQYLIQHETIITNLKEEQEKLKGMKQALQGRVDAEIRKGYEIVPNVQKWLSDVAAIEDQLRNFYENIEVSNSKNKQKCFHGQCPNLALNYSLGKRATKSTQHITSLKEGEKYLDQNQIISYPTPTFLEDELKLESRNKIIEDVIEKLKNDEIKRISVCGMGGVGKTTLVKKLIQIVEKSKLFDEVVVAVVSRNPNYEKIHNQIVDCLGLKMKSAIMEVKARELHQWFEKSGKVLIVLDDVWDEHNFEQIGIPSRDHQKRGIKILFTSRNEKVCQKMGSQENFQVSVLSMDEAWSLFREMAGDVVDKLDINPIAKEIVGECGGLPLAIVTVGRTLHNEEKLAWIGVLNQLRNSQVSSFSEMQECVYSRIELSFNFLDNEQKCCLFLCGLFPQDFDIPIESLFRYGVGLGLFEEAVGTLWEVRNQVNYWVNILKRCFLLLDSDEPGCVKMNDVVRDVVLNIAFRGELGIFVHNNVESKRLRQGKWSRISLVLDDMHMIELENEVLEYIPASRLEILQVQSQRKTTIPWLENFIRGTSKLKVLALQNLCIPQIPSLHQTLVNLQMLQVEGCDVGDISIIGKELKKLEILSFAYSNIKELPNEIGLLGFLRLLDLTECDDLNFISPNVLARLSRLEEFYFRVKNFPWMLNKVIIKELGVISHQLKVLEIKVSNKEVFPSNWIFKNLEVFWVYMVPYLDSHVRQGYIYSSILDLRYTNCSSIKNTQLVEKCEVLRLNKVKDLKNGIFQLDDNGLQYLKDLRIFSCPNIEFVIYLNVHSLCCAFPLIKSLFLNNLAKLREVFHASYHHEFKTSMIGFSNLLELELRMLPRFIGFSNTLDFNGPNQPIYPRSSSGAKLANSRNVEDGEVLSRSHSETNGNEFYQVSPKLFSFNWMKQFPKLERILLHECISLKIVFDLQGYSQSNGDALLFPNLKNIVISRLSNLTFVWYNVPNCILGYQSLRSLTISNCDSLTHVFTSVIVKAITNLETLEVKSCELVENIIVWNDMDKEKIVLPNLQYLVLEDLLNLKSFYQGSSDFNFPSLEEVELFSFNWMKQFPKLKKILLDNCISLEIVFDLQGYSQSNGDALLFPQLESIVISSLSKLTFVWYNVSNCVMGFQSLRSLTISNCDSLTHVFTSVIVKAITNLETLEVKSCELVENIIVWNDMDKEKIVLPNLQYLVLEDLLNLKSFYQGSSDFNFPSLEEVELFSFNWMKQFPKLKKILLDNCISLEIVFDLQGYSQSNGDALLFPQLESIVISSLSKLTFVWYNVSNCVMGFQSLRSLTISNCDSLTHVFTSVIVKAITNLETLEVKSCELVENIIVWNDMDKEKIVLPNLQYLVLEDLLNLKSFYQGSSDFNFPSLEEVVIRDCPTMEVFLQGSSHTPKLKNVTMEIEQYRGSYVQNKDLNAIIRRFKAFVALEEFDKLDWAELQKKGIFEWFMVTSKRMVIRSCHKTRTVFPFNETQMFQHVRELLVKNCYSLTEVFETKKEDVTHYELQNLQHNIIIRHASFQELTSITIDSCPSLKSLLSYSMAKSLERLQELCVYFCNLMEEIVTMEDKNNINSDGGSKVAILFPQLMVLRIQYLPNLECVYSGDYNYDLPLCDDVVEGHEINNDENKIQILFPKLEKLELHEVPKLKCFCAGAYDYDILNISSIEEYPTTSRFPRGNVIVSAPNLHQVQLDYIEERYMYTCGDLNLMIHYSQNRKKYQVELQKLDTFTGLELEERLFGYILRETHLLLQGCHKLLSYIPSNMKNLLFSHLEKLHIIGCECLKEIFESSDYEGDNKVQRYNLQKLELYYLLKVKHIWKIHGQVSCFQNLRSINISQCHNLRYVFPDVSTAKSLPKLYKICVSECNNMEEIFWNESNSNFSREQEKLKEAKIRFSNLYDIELVKLPRLNSFLPSTFSCYVELPSCSSIVIEECPKMKCFCYDGNLYTPNLYKLRVEGADFDTNEDLNEVLQQRKWSERELLE